MIVFIFCRILFFFVCFRPGSHNRKADAFGQDVLWDLTGFHTCGPHLPAKNFVGQPFSVDYYSASKKVVIEILSLLTLPYICYILVQMGFGIFGQCLCVPKAARLEVLHLIHDSISAGHTGVHKTKKLFCLSIFCDQDTRLIFRNMFLHANFVLETRYLLPHP